VLSGLAGEKQIHRQISSIGDGFELLRGLRNSIICNELKNDFIGRLELNFGGIDCEFGVSARLLPLLLKSVTTFFNNLV